MTESFRAGGPGWNDRHLDAYLKTGGKIGHLVDFTPAGGPQTPCLILQTTGGDGMPRHLTLIYGKDGGNFVVLAHAEASQDRPDWFLDLQAEPAIRFQVLDAKYAGRAEIAAEPERGRLFELLTKIHPPYGARQENAALPVVILQPETTIDRL